MNPDIHSIRSAVLRLTEYFQSLSGDHAMKAAENFQGYLNMLETDFNRAASSIGWAIARGVWELGWSPEQADQITKLSREIEKAFDAYHSAHRS